MFNRISNPSLQSLYTDLPSGEVRRGPARVPANSGAPVNTTSLSPEALRRRAERSRMRAFRHLPEEFAAADHSTPDQRQGCADEKPLPSALNQRMVSLLQSTYPDWAAKHLHALIESDPEKLAALCQLCDQHRAWTKTHFDEIHDKPAGWLHYVRPLVARDPALATKHLPHLRLMDKTQLQALLPYVANCPEWLGKHIDKFHGVPGYQLYSFYPLVEKHPDFASRRLHTFIEMPKLRETLYIFLQFADRNPEWTERHIDFLVRLNEGQHENDHHHRLRALFTLFDKHPEWTDQHLDALVDIRLDQLRALPPIVKENETWASLRLPDLKRLADDELFAMAYFIGRDFDWTAENVDNLLEDRSLLPYLYEYCRNTHHDIPQAMDEIKSELGQLQRAPIILSDWAQVVAGKLDAAAKGFHRAANPYLRKLLGRLPESVARKILEAQGASRSLLDPEKALASSLTTMCQENHQKLGKATFGLEIEMFVPGLERPDDGESTEDRREPGLHSHLGTARYRFVKDRSLRTPTDLANPVEMNSPILETPDQIMELQGILSILHDWGVFRNHTAGIHIHTGVSQWNTADCLGGAEIERNPAIKSWDATNGKDPTPLQLLFMKQFVINMAAMQEGFGQVARNTAQPNALAGLDSFCQLVSDARNLKGLIFAAQQDSRRRCVNLLPYERIQTVEVRGFTKKNSSSMDVDPNIPLRDIVFLQEVLIKTLGSMRELLLANPVPGTAMRLQSSEGLDEVVDRYAQDVLLFQIVHALAQRQSGKRIETMTALVNDRKNIRPETVNKIAENHGALMEDDLLGRHFLSALRGDAAWNPADHIDENMPPKRKLSLRTMVDVITGSTS